MFSAANTGGIGAELRGCDLDEKNRRDMRRSYGYHHRCEGARCKEYAIRRMDVMKPFIGTSNVSARRVAR